MRTLAITVKSSEESFEDVIAEADRIIDSIEFHAPRRRHMSGRWIDARKLEGGNHGEIVGATVVLHARLGRGRVWR